MSLHVLEPGLFSLVVDLGRPHTRSLGVPVGGAADRTSFMLGNALVGNPPDAAALEISLAGPTLRAECELGCVVYGAPFDLRCGLRELQAGKTFTLRAGEVLRVGGTPEGMRAYLCVRGGIQSPVVMDSRSGLAALRAGETVSCQAGHIPVRFIQQPGELCPWGPARHRLRVVEGTQSGWFVAQEFYGRPDANPHPQPPSFIVTPASNRMGVRLKGEPLTIPAQELLSEPVCPGVVQVTRDGQCIVLGVDGQTIGGYPKMAHVIGADLDLLGQLRPGDVVRFVRVSLEEAQELHRRKKIELHRWLTRLQLSA